MNRSPALARTAGYTIDQMILVVAIIAILVTLIIISIGWNLINRSSGTKLASQLRQIEDANGQFYSANRLWPDQAYTAPATSATNNMRALAGVTTGFTYTVANTANIKNYIPGFRMSGTNVLHDFSSTNNTITMLRGSPTDMNGNYMMVQFRNVPFTEVQEAERAIDGGDGASADYAAGRLRATTNTGGTCMGATVSGAPTASTSGGTLVNVCYAANMLD